MLNNIVKAFSKFFGTKSEKDLKEIMPYVEKIKQEYAKLPTLSDEQLRQKTQEFIAYIEQQLNTYQEQTAAIEQQIAADPAMDIATKEKLWKEQDRLKEERLKRLEEVLLELLPQAFAVVKETARRLTENKQLVVSATDHDYRMAAIKSNVVIENGQATWLNRWVAAGNEVEWNMVHYDVQLIGGIVLHRGMIAEMQTGEGKTLVSTLPAYLNALAKRGVHIVTVNDYLAIRDSEWNAPLFEFHGLIVDCIDKHQPNSEQRRNAYMADIVYGTNNEFGFDYLRDNMVRSKAEMVQREHHYAMVDEVDSVLIDDARTPLIISGPVSFGNDEQEFVYLKPGVEYIIEEQRKLVQGYLVEAKRLIKEGKDEEAGLCLLRAHRGLPEYKPLIKFLSEVGMKQLLQKTENHYMADNNRLMPEADKPLFFRIDKKHNSVDLTGKGIEAITGNHEKDFFILPDIGVDLDRIEKDASISEDEKVRRSDQLLSDYSVKSQRIHTVQQLLKAYSLFEKDVDYIIVDGKVKIVDEQTGRIMEGRRYSDGLHQALEAKENVHIEAATQTYATVTLQNYFRMYHKLSGMTGTAETEAGEFWEIYKLDVVSIPTNRPISRKDMEDKVYRTVREKFNAVAEEIQRLVQDGRPVLVGTTSVENSELLSRMLQMRRIPHQVLNAKQHAKEADIVAKAGLQGQVTIATNMAGRGTDIKLSPEVKAAGGLAIIGTERHESRRVDRQLRGRAGRQGDPGSSQFYVSLEDNLMRLFGSDRIARIMDSMGLEEGEVIQHSMITRSIERAQRKVEENNFGIRKRLLEYDNVMNYQREVIYRRRRNALSGDRLQLDVANTFMDVSYNLAESHVGNYEGLRMDCLKFLGLNNPVSQDDVLRLKEEKLGAQLYKASSTHYREKNERLVADIMPLLLQLHAERGEMISEFTVPITDGRFMVNVTAGLQKVIDSNGAELIKKIEQTITLSVIDQNWKEHLRSMDDLKTQVQNAVHEQKDPLLIYKFESFELFKSFLTEVNQEVISFLSKARVPDELLRQPEPMPTPAEVAPEEDPFAHAHVSRGEDEEEEASKTEKVEHPRQPMRSEKKYTPNDRVTVKYTDGTVKQDVKFKKIEEDLLANKCFIIE